MFPNLYSGTCPFEDEAHRRTVDVVTEDLETVSARIANAAVNQRSAWFRFLAHLLRVALARKGGLFSGPVEVDETYMGGQRKNMSNVRREALEGTGRGAVGKVAVVGAEDQATKRVAARVVYGTDNATLQGCVTDDIMGGMMAGMEHKRLRYEDLIVDNGLASGARSCASPFLGRRLAR